MKNDNLTRRFINVILATAVLLLVPVVAMRFTDEVDWTASDFVVAGGLLVVAGSAYVLLTHHADNPTRRAVIGLIVLAGLAVVWAELAVGLFGTPFSGS